MTMTAIRMRLRALFNRAAAEQDLNELRFHLEQETAKLMSQGHSPEEAHRRARLAFGSGAAVFDSLYGQLQRTR